MSRLEWRRASQSGALLILAALWAAGCSDDGEGGTVGTTDTPVPVSRPVDEIPDGSFAIGGTVVVESGAPLADVIVSSDPPSELVRTTAQGEYVLLQGIGEGTWEVRAEREGYAPAFGVVTISDLKFRRADMVMVPEEQASQLTFTPGAVEFPPTRRIATVFVENPSEDALTFTIAEGSRPAWLDISASAREVAVGSPELIDIYIDPGGEGFTAEQGASHVLRIEDSEGRRALLPLVVEEIRAELMEFTFVGTERSVAASFDEQVTLEYRVEYDGEPVEGERVVCSVRDTAGDEGGLNVELTLSERSDYAGIARCSFTPERGEATGASLNLDVVAAVPAFGLEVEAIHIAVNE